MCQDETARLNVTLRNRTSGVIPAELNLIPTQQSNGILNSTITWKQEDQTITNYLITILPPPPYGPNEIMTSTASAKLSLSDSIQYSITISLIVCAKWINTTFTFGSCRPLLWNSSIVFVMQYNLDVSGILSALIRFATQDVNMTHVIECGMNGHWNTDLDVCTSLSTIKTSKENDILFMTESADIENFTVNAEEEKLSTQVSLPVLLFVFVLAGSVIGSSLLTFIIGILLGLVCGVKHRPKKGNITLSMQQICTPVENSTTVLKSPIYEEMDCEEKTTPLNLSQNIAYEQAKKE